MINANSGLVKIFTRKMPIENHLSVPVVLLLFVTITIIILITKGSFIREI